MRQKSWQLIFLSFCKAGECRKQTTYPNDSSTTEKFQVLSTTIIPSEKVA